MTIPSHPIDRPPRTCRMPDVELRPFLAERDLALIARWLQHAEVARWWGEAPDALAEVARHPADSAAMIVAGGMPVGYLCWQTPSRAELEAAGLADLPDDLVDIDIMIGEPAMQGRGIGPAALALVLARLRARGARLAGAATCLANRRALSAFAKAGLLPYRDFFELGEEYRYFTIRLDTATLA